MQKLKLILAITLLLLVPPLRRWGLTVGPALCLARGLYPAVERLRSRRVPQWAAIALVMGGLLTLLGLMLWVAAERLCGAATSFGTLFASFEPLNRGLDTLLSHLPAALREALTLLRRLLAREGSALYRRLLAWAGTAGGALAAALPRLGLRLVMLLLGCAYALADWERVRAFLLRQIPPDWEQSLRGLFGMLLSGVRVWLRAEGTLLLIQFGILLAGLLLLRMDSPLSTAALIALADALPLVGAGIVLLPWAALCYFTGEALRALGLGLLWLTLWGVRTALEPRLLGKRAGTNAFTSLIVLYLGYECFGVAGLLAAPVVLAAVMGR